MQQFREIKTKHCFDYIPDHGPRHHSACSELVRTKTAGDALEFTVGGEIFALLHVHVQYDRDDSIYTHIVACLIGTIPQMEKV